MDEIAVEVSCEVVASLNPSGRFELLSQFDLRTNTAAYADFRTSIVAVDPQVLSSPGRWNRAWRLLLDFVT